MSNFENNPYAPPRSQDFFEQDTSEYDYWIDDDCLIVRKNGMLPPDICIHSGEPTDGFTMTKHFQWMPAWIYALLLISPIIYLIVALIIKKSGVLTYGVGPKFAFRRKIGLSIGWVGSLSMLALIILGVLYESSNLVLISVVLLIISIIVGAVLVQPFKIKKIDELYVYIKPKIEVLERLQTSRQ